MKLPSVLLLLVSSFSALAAPGTTDMSKEAIKERIKPIAQVHVAGAQAAADVASGPRSGEDVFKTSCFACHGTGAMGAPKVGNAGDWGPRVEQGLDTLLNHALNGINAMPPRGTCGSCSDDEIKAAIEHMIEGI